MNKVRASNFSFAGTMSVLGLISVILCAALRDIASVPGITRILTSGHATTRVYEPASLDVLKTLAGSALALPRQKDDSAPLRIVAGSGISPNTIGPVLSALGNEVNEYHMSGRIPCVDGIARAQVGKVEEFQMGPRAHDWAGKTDAGQVRGVLKALERMQQCENA